MLIADGNRTRAAPRGPFPALFTLSSSPCVSKASSFAAKIPRKLLRVECLAVFGELICVRTRKKPQRILCVLSRLLTKYWHKSADENRRGFDSRQLYQDLMVCPDHQGKGIGTDLMDKMIEYLKEKRIYMISVVYEERLKPFYERFGFYNMLCGQMETY